MPHGRLNWRRAQPRWAVRPVLENAQDGLLWLRTRTAPRGRLPSLGLGGRAALDALCDQLSERPNVLIQTRTVQRGEVPAPVV